MPSILRTRSITEAVQHSPVILEVTEEDSSTENVTNNNTLKPPASEYTSLLSSTRAGSASRSHRRSNVKYQTMDDTSGMENDTSEDDPDADTDELISNTSSNITSSMSKRQLVVFIVVMVSTFSCSFSVCLFPPFFPEIAESKGVSATGYGLIIATNCLTAFLVTPFIGNHLNIIGVKTAYCLGLFGGGICCGLSGTLEFFSAGPSFLAIAVIIRICHAICNAMVITASFTYTACEFPSSVAKIFSLTRTAMNIAQMGGPWLGGMLYEQDGFYLPFLVMGCLQVLVSVFAVCVLPKPEEEEDEDADASATNRKKKGKVSLMKVLKIPTIWFSFLAFIVATICNGFLSVNLEPKVLRQFHLTPSNVGLLYGLRDGANSLASPVWGYLCDRKKSVKPYLVISALLVASSFFILKGYNVVGLEMELTMYLLVASLCLNGFGISGQQVVGVVDALHEAVGAGYPDDASTQGLVAGLWSSLSGMGRFISRAGSGYLVDEFGFGLVSALACSLQVLCGVATFVYLVMFECHLQKRNYTRWEDVTVVEHGRKRNEKVVFTESSGPTESLMARSVYIGIPSKSAGLRIANSMPPKPLGDLSYQRRGRSRSVR